METFDEQSFIALYTNLGARHGPDEVGDEQRHHEPDLFVRTEVLRKQGERPWRRCGLDPFGGTASPAYLRQLRRHQLMEPSPGTSWEAPDRPRSRP